MPRPTLKGPPGLPTSQVSDPYVGRQGGDVEGSAWDVSAVTPSDSTVFNPMFRALYIGGAGNVALRTPAGNTRTFVGLPVGTQLMVRGDQVLATGTTATNIMALH